MSELNIKHFIDAYIKNRITFDGACELIGNYTRHIGSNYHHWIKLMPYFYSEKELEKALKLIRMLKDANYLA